MNFSLNTNREDLSLMQSTIAKFCEAEIAPEYDKWENEGIFPRDLWNKLGQAGLLCVDIPEKYGGHGADAEMALNIPCGIACGNYGSVAVGMSVHSDIVAHYILNRGNENQKLHYLPKMVTGELVGAIAMTEPAAGSDLQGIQTKAKKQNGGWVLNGSKTFITNGQHADFVVTVAKTNPNVKGSSGVSLFLVDTSLKGFSRGRNLEKLGLHSSDTSELFFDEVEVPDSAILGEVDQGFITLMTELPRERLALAMSAVAAMEYMMDITKKYVSERKAFGKELSTFQNTRFKMAKLQTELRLNKAFIKECVGLFAEGKLDAATASMAKVAATEAQCKMADECLQLFGGYGYMKEYPISRAFADARIQKIYGGTSEIMLELVARDLFN
ncbi:MAG: acyl-CoA dehydrogenase family protein [Pseudomonadota bacterium]|jgi:acyl-CoA dehydrogenase|nr:acyl-CoA dehydrogenase family protein [Pseudomonadota bacterium]|tara:strand:+ start:213 stop:1367 length:1155 start_codon:yes stop_codon:yes gene_type:complete